MIKTGIGVLLQFVLVILAAGQVRAPFDGPAASFILKQGSTFSASGGSSEGLGSRPSPIAADILEAQRIIAGQHIDGDQLKPADLTKNAITGMLDALDPHSNFYDRAEWTDLMDEQRSGYTGIGATIANFERGGVIDTFVVSTFAGSPAADARLRYGDRIVAVNGEPMVGKTSDVVRDKIRGTAGSSFRMTVERASDLRHVTLQIRRGRVAQPSIPDAYILRPGIGYIDLSEGFNYTTAGEFDTALAGLKRQGMTSLILDLRGNGGGIVDQAVKVASRFLPAGTVVVTQRGRTRLDNRTWRSSDPNPETLPLVVLVDEETASASEIVAGAFQDTDRALIIGEKTFGKGLVQSVIELPGRTGLTLTTARYLTPSGRSIQRDYVRTDRYDYYHHRSQAAAAGAFFEARTITDRRVVGGDGVHPDEAVTLPRLTPDEAKLLDPLFFFTRDLLNGRVPGISIEPVAGASTRRILSGDMIVTPAMMARFTDYLSANSEAFAPPPVGHGPFVKMRLRHNLVMGLHGVTSAGQVLIEDDPQVARAVDALPRAAQLANRANQARRSRQR
ncbi:MAG: S41 family peptidase [Chloracidobacterium sp.]|nr:S41 family peptidase [Chloracidobacterium sp.]